jgi:hypothetical protein
MSLNPLLCHNVLAWGLADATTAVPLAVNASGQLVASSAAGAPSLAVTKITALALGTATLAARATRRSVEILCLDDSAETIYYGPTTGVNATTGARLKAGQSKVVDYKGALFFYGAAGTGTVQTVETYD